MKRTKVAAIVVSALFALGLIAPAIIVNSGGSNPGLIYMASNFGTQSNIPAKITGTNLTNITILHTNDIHSHFLPWPVADYKPGTGNDASVGGMSRIAYLVNKTRNEAVEPVLLFDAGDFLMGTPLEWVGMLPGAASGYSVELDVLANLSYDAVAIGNHEWDYGVLGLSYILANTSINAPYGLPPLLCSNLNLSTPYGYDYLGIGTYIKDNLTIDIGSLRIGVFSVIGYGASAVEFFVPVSGYSFSDPIQIAQQEVAWFTQNGRMISLYVFLTVDGKKTWFSPNRLLVST